MGLGMGEISTNTFGNMAHPSGHLGNEKFSNQLIELSGDSIEKLEWTVLDLKLEKARYAHSAFYIPNETYLALNK